MPVRTPIPLRRRLKFERLSQLPQVPELLRSRPDTTEAVLVECSMGAALSSRYVLAECILTATLGQSTGSLPIVQSWWPGPEATEAEVSDRAGIATVKPHGLRPRPESAPVCVFF